MMIYTSILKMVNYQQYKIDLIFAMRRYYTTHALHLMVAGIPLQVR